MGKKDFSVKALIRFIECLKKIKIFDLHLKLVERRQLLV